MTSKARVLSDAIREFVRPRDHLHFAFAGARPNAALRALAEEFRGQDPRFVVSATSLGSSQLGLFLLDMGLFAHVIAGYVGHQYPAPRPATVAVGRFRDGRTTLEGWSLLTLLQRLRAGALGLNWLPTTSLDAGSLPEVRAKVRAIDVDGEVITLVPALRPDIAFVHGIVADEEGNTVIAPPYVEGTVGAIAARRGVIVTVEKIVPRRELRRHSSLPMVPGMCVLSVSEAPFGGHPGGIFADAVDPKLSYSEDYAFILDSVQALEATADARDAWERRWMLGVASDPSRYPSLLPSGRADHLRRWWRDYSPRATSLSGQATPTEQMIIGAAHALDQAARLTRASFLFAGIGTSSLAAWLARGTGANVPPLVSEMGFYDYVPAAGDPWLFSFANVPDSQILTDTDLILAQLIQGHGARGMGVLATGQIDRHGNLNTSYVAGRFMTGSGGANDVASGIADLTVLVPHRPGRLVEHVDYVTSPGHAVKRIVTDLAVFQRDSSEDFVLTTLLRDGDKTALVEQIRAATPWPVVIRGDLQQSPGPTAEELSLLRAFDPERFFLGTLSPRVGLE